MKRLAFGVLGLMMVLTAVAAPLADGLQLLPSSLGDGAPEPAPLVLFGLALLALGMFLQHRAGGGWSRR